MFSFSAALTLRKANFCWPKYWPQINQPFAVLTALYSVLLYFYTYNGFTFYSFSIHDIFRLVVLFHN